MAAMSGARMRRLSYALDLGLPGLAGAGAGRRFSAAFARRTSALTLASVLGLWATGVFTAVFELRSRDQLWTTGYGWALLVETALLPALTAFGRRDRSGLLPAGVLTRLRRSAAVEPLVFAGVVLAVAFLTQLLPGRDAPQARAAAPAQDQLPPPPPPPVGAIVLAQEAGRRAVAIAVRPGRVSATVLAPSGGGEDGLHVSLNGTAATPCGHGCYAANVPSARRVLVAIDGRAVVFRLPRTARRADALVRRATRVFESLRSVVYRESLASSPTNRIFTTWELQAPDRLAYAISDGVRAVVIGGVRWDRTGNGPWRKSQTSPLQVPRTTWGTYVLDAHVLVEDGPVAVVSWANPGIPAWFTVRFDRRTLRPLDLKMTAAAHFMHQRYLAFNRLPRIRPPR